MARAGQGARATVTKVPRTAGNNTTGSIREVHEQRRGAVGRVACEAGRRRDRGGTRHGIRRDTTVADEDDRSGKRSGGTGAEADAYQAGLPGVHVERITAG